MTSFVLVPGLMCTDGIWGPQLSALWPYGSVQVASTAGRSVPEMAAGILSNAPASFGLAGISMGGYIALEIMRQARERVERLALIDTTARPDTPEQIAGRHALLNDLAGDEFVEKATAALMSLLHPDHQDDEKLRAVNERIARTIGWDGLARQVAAVIPRIDSRPSLPAIAAPTLVMVGEQDRLTPIELAREIADAIPDAELVIVAQSGHGSTIEQPDAVNEALVRWATA